MQLKDLNWNHLYYFNELARFQSLKRTAQFLNLAPSTLSEHLKRLEQSLEVVLFVRTSKGLTLSEEGRKLFERTKEVFEQGAKIIEPFRKDSLGGYPVNVGIEDGMTLNISTEIVSQYWDYYTNFGVVNTLRASESSYIIDFLLSGQIDWGLTHVKPRSKKVDFQLIDQYRVQFCCSMDLFKRFKKSSDIIVNIPFYEGNTRPGHSLLEKYLSKQKIYPKERILSDHYSFVRDLCERGRCVMPVIKNPLDKYKGLKVFELDLKFEIPLFAVWKKSDEGLISIQKLRQLLQTKITELPTRYDDIALQIEAADVGEDLLK